MAPRRRKNRTHVKAPETESTGPKSFVIKSGEVTRSISQLVRDMRKVMEPGTASRLRERQAARLRDYLIMASPLGVSHLMVFTLTEAANVHLRMARIPAGPTLTFRVERYSLMKDLVNASLRNIGKAPGGEYRTPPLLVLNNFQQPPGEEFKPQLKLMTTMFQSLFPPIQVDRAALPSFRRVLLVSYQSETHLISMRHYVISVRPHGVSRRVRKVLNDATSTSQGKSATRTRANLGSAEDIADYLLRRVNRSGSAAPSDNGSEAYSEATSGAASGTNYDSASETDASEAESDSNAVELPEDYVGRGNKKGQKKAVRLVEVGPRMELRLIKVVEGLVGSKKGEGETVFHEFVHKSKKDAAKQAASHNARRREKEERRKQQEENVARKKALADAAAAKKVAFKAGEAGEAGADEDEEEDEFDTDGDDPEVEGLSDDEDDEDRFGGGVDDDAGDGDDWADDAGDVSESEDEGGDDDNEESEAEEVQAKPTKKAKRS